MKYLFNSLFTLLLFLCSAALFYIAFVTPFPSSFVNIALFMIAIFVLLQGCANVDKQMKLGDYANDDVQDSEENNPPEKIRHKSINKFNKM